MPKRQINANDPLNSKLVMDRDSTSSRSNNYRSRRYDDTEPEPERVKAGEGNTRDKHNRSHTTEESKKPRTSSSRSKSPNCRWDDPMKLFSEVSALILLIIHHLYYSPSPSPHCRSTSPRSPQNTVPHPIVSISNLAVSGTGLIGQMASKWLTLKNWPNSQLKRI